MLMLPEAASGATDGINILIFSSAFWANEIHD